MGTGEARGPLDVLCDRLLRGRPPRLSAVISLLGEVESFQDFKKLVGEFLPEAEQQIMQAGSPSNMVAAFAKAFETRYFPLADYLLDAEGFEYLLSFIPIEVYGYEWDDYREVPDFRQGAILSSLLVDFEAELDMTGEGIRVMVLEAAEKFVSRELLRRVPPSGYPLDFLRRALAKRHRGLLYFAQALCHDSDNYFLDATDEDLSCNPPDWSRETVEELTRQWREMTKKSQAMSDFWEWLEKDPEARFRELLGFLKEKADGTRTGLGGA